MLLILSQFTNDQIMTWRKQVCKCVVFCFNSVFVYMYGAEYYLIVFHAKNIEAVQSQMLSSLLRMHER